MASKPLVYRWALLRDCDVDHIEHRRPDLTLSGTAPKIFTVFYILIGIGIVVEAGRQLGSAFVEVHRQDREAVQAKMDAKKSTWAQPSRNGHVFRRGSHASARAPGLPANLTHRVRVASLGACPGVVIPAESGTN